MNLPRSANRSAKFAYDEIIVHRIDDDTYPNIYPERPGISPWFKLELLDFYHGGLQAGGGTLAIAAIFKKGTARWILGFLILALALFFYWNKQNAQLGKRNEKA